MASSARDFRKLSAETSCRLRFNFFCKAGSDDVVHRADYGQAVVSGFNSEALNFGLLHDDKYLCMVREMDGLRQFDLTGSRRLLRRCASYGLIFLIDEVGYEHPYLIENALICKSLKN